MRGIQLWRSGGVQSPVEEFIAPSVHCLVLRPYLIGISGRSPVATRPWREAISLAKELNDMHALALALLFWAVILGHFEA